MAKIKNPYIISIKETKSHYKEQMMSVVINFENLCHGIICASVCLSSPESLS